jgi:hypothetical protein
MAVLPSAAGFSACRADAFVALEKGFSCIALKVSDPVFGYAGVAAPGSATTFDARSAPNARSFWGLVVGPAERCSGRSNDHETSS